jgi:hypothetical protein
MNDNEGSETKTERPKPEWQRAHTELVRLAHERARLESDEAHWLLRALRSSAHARLGYACFAEYIERIFGYSPRWTAEKLRVAEALENLPALSRAVAEITVPWSVARELTRVATAETETEWLAAATGHTVRDVERLVSGHRPGSHPYDRGDTTAERHALRFEVSGLVLATFREALAKLRRDAGERLDDDDALLLMARHVLEGPTNASHSSYQMAITLCEQCQSGSAIAPGGSVPVQPPVVDMATCDAQSFTFSNEHDGNGDEPTHVGRPSRAQSSIAPSIRRLVHHRDHGKCQVPGCRHAVFVDVHHLIPKAEGGSSDPANLITLCSAHHRAIHRGELVVVRSDTRLAFRHADGSVYGSSRASPLAADARSKAFRGLRSLGFSEAESRRALVRIAPHVGPGATAETLLRRALADLTAPSPGSSPAREQVFDPKAA